MTSHALGVVGLSNSLLEHPQVSSKAGAAATAPLAQSVPVGNSLGASTVVVASPGGDYSLDLSAIFEKSTASTAAPTPPTIPPAFERFNSMRVYRESAVEGLEAQFLSLDTLYAIVRAIRNLFNYYVLTWGDDARLVCQTISSINQQDFRLDILDAEGNVAYDWLRDLQRIKTHQEVIAHFLGDKAPAFRAFLVMVEERLCKNGVANESERLIFGEELEIIRKVMSCPADVAYERLGHERVVARAILEGFQLLEATLSSLSLRQFREELVYYTTLLIQHEPSETLLTAVTGPAKLVDQLRYSLSMTAKELLVIIHAHKERFDRIFTVQPVLAYLIKEASQEKCSTEVIEIALQETALTRKQQKVAMRIIQEILATGSCDFDMVEIDFHAESQALEKEEGGGALIAAVFANAFDTVQQFIGIERARALMPERVCREILAMSQGGKSSPESMKDALLTKFTPAFDVQEVKAAIELRRETIVSIISDAQYQSLLASFA